MSLANFRDIAHQKCLFPEMSAFRGAPEETAFHDPGALPPAINI
jgi:hypothetical protein